MRGGKWNCVTVVLLDRVPYSGVKLITGGSLIRLVTPNSDFLQGCWMFDWLHRYSMFSCLWRSNKYFNEFTINKANFAWKYSYFRKCMQSILIPKNSLTKSWKKVNNLLLVYGTYRAVGRKSVLKRKDIILYCVKVRLAVPVWFFSYMINDSSYMCTAIPRAFCNHDLWEIFDCGVEFCSGHHRPGFYFQPYGWKWTRFTLLLLLPGVKYLVQ